MPFLPKRRWHRSEKWLVGGGCAAFVIVSLYAWRTHSDVPHILEESSFPDHIALSKDGSVLAVSGGESRGSSIHLRDARTGGSLAKFSFGGLSNVAALSPDGSQIGVITDPGTFSLINRESRKPRWSFSLPGRGTIMRAHFLPDQKQVFLWNSTAQPYVAQAHIINIATGKIVRLWKVHLPADLAIDISPDGRTLVTCQTAHGDLMRSFYSRRPSFLDIESGHFQGTLEAKNAQNAIFSADGQSMFVLTDEQKVDGTWAPTLLSFDAKTKRKLWQYDLRRTIVGYSRWRMRDFWNTMDASYEVRVLGLATSPSGKSVAVSRLADSAVFVFDARTGKLEQSHVPPLSLEKWKRVNHGFYPPSLVWSADGKHLFTLGTYAVYRWDLD